MTITIKALIAIGVVWICTLLFPPKIEAHFILNALLPASALEKLNETERLEVLKRYEYKSRPSFLSWFLACTVITLSGVAYWQVKKNKTRYVYVGLDENVGDNEISPYHEPQYRSNIRYHRYDENKMKAKERANINKILEKISVLGFDKLTDAEREKLQKYSQKT